MKRNFWVIQYEFDNKWGVKCKPDTDMEDILVSNCHLLYDSELDARIDAILCETIYTDQRLEEIKYRIDQMNSK